ncbi:Pdp3-interacting factor 1 [Neolecta irregularis DAH-3]|uniref:Pdp3-interacting factor 1 n=1 Tax=Neolecta irregularis (strain DAH-3) TaxID=1198029 RepID=A0A1U7LN94_NEOID|nr:Pdp3-interacting factor 1 [Neolecta irregularis DAH-3]|eukprot:OLL24109.1 Pdp3-interacting factor 1 [Neolecta irregularis DAH-3]
MSPPIVDSPELFPTKLLETPMVIDLGSDSEPEDRKEHQDQDQDREILIFSDFDGTIFMQDTGHILFDSHGCGADRRKALDAQISSGERSFRKVSEEMWGSLDIPFGKGLEIIKGQLEIDPAFRDFHAYCLKQKIPFNIISAGLKPILRAVLEEFLGAEQAKHIDIISNDAVISEDGTAWKPIWRDDTPHGHDKAASIKQARAAATMSRPVIVFIGDGVSDLPGAREADILFARRGLRLHEYCIENNIPHIPFDTFADIKREIQRISKEEIRSKKYFNVPLP